ncbi:MAG: hypothetical protein ISS49_03980 [Anaerolineae bacterium]|nr:hypothetical protein [Anaerolineae bacterium]
MINPGQTYTIVVNYDESALPSRMSESGLALYYWDGSDWVEEPTSVVDSVNDTITATPNHFSAWAALAEYRIYLPFVMRNR